jgi:hypothetical protein
VDADVVVGTWAGDLPLLLLPTVSTNEMSRYPKIDEALSRHVREFSSCFAVARKEDPRLWGRLALSFSIDNDGKPRDVSEKQSHFGNTNAVDCVRSVLGSLILSEQRNTSGLVLAFRLQRPTAVLAPENDRAYTEPEAVEQLPSTEETKVDGAALDVNEPSSTSVPTTK